MKFEEIIPALKAGKKVRRKSRKDYGYIKDRGIFVVGEITNQDDVIYALTIEDLEAADWEIIREPKKVKLRDLTEEQYKKWFEKKCKNDDGECGSCPFTKVGCLITYTTCWIKNKECYSDKFLDQEIEIEEE